MPTHGPTSARYADHLITSAAIRDLGNDLHNVAPNLAHADQAIQVHVFVPTADDVHHAATTAGTTVDVTTTGDHVITTTRVGYGYGTDPASTLIEYRHAAILQVGHVATVPLDVEAVPA